MNKRYEPVLIDLTDRRGPGAEVARKYGVRGIPTVIFYAPDGREIDRVSGGLAADAFESWLDACEAKAQ